MPFADPQKARDYQREYRRRQRAAVRAGTPVDTLPEVRVETAGDVLLLLEGQVEAVLADANVDSVMRARTVGYLCSVMLRAVEAKDLVARVEALEAVLKVREPA
jgi:hypothetical protein